MDYQLGLARLKQALANQDADTNLTFATLEARLIENLEDERYYGKTDTIRHDRGQILEALNQLALDRTGAYFINLCLPGAAAELPAPPSTKPDLPWVGGMEVLINEKNYLLHDPVEQTLPADRSFVLYRAKAQDLDQEDGSLVWIKRMQVSRETSAARQARQALNREGQLLQELARADVFPALLYKMPGAETIELIYTFTPGYTLAEAFGSPDQPLDAGRALRLLRSLRPACRMLRLLHQRNLAHRNLTPETLILRDNRRDCLGLQDLGLAAWPSLPGEGPVLYRAPEQAAFMLPSPGPAADIYQLGAIVYHFLTGRSPGSFLGTPEAPSTLNPLLTTAIDAVLLKALDKDPADRWEDVSAFSTTLQQAADALRNQMRGA